jgi:hypothetical protein
MPSPVIDPGSEIAALLQTAVALIALSGSNCRFAISVAAGSVPHFNLVHNSHDCK